MKKTDLLGFGYEVLYNFADDSWTGVYFGKTRAQCELYLSNIRLEPEKYKIRSWFEEDLFGEGQYG